MSDIKLGKIIIETANRDAIHIAIAPVSSDEKVYPGDHVVLVAGTTDKVQSLRGAENEIAIGVVDPFLAHPVQAGQKFWLLLYPQTITSLRHEWTHPAFQAGESNIETSRRWLQKKADNLGVSYVELISALTRNEYRCSFGTDINYGDGCEAEPAMWDHLRVITGIDVPAKDRPEHFRCTC